MLDAVPSAPSVTSSQQLAWDLLESEAAEPGTGRNQSSCTSSTGHEAEHLTDGLLAECRAAVDVNAPASSLQLASLSDDEADRQAAQLLASIDSSQSLASLPGQPDNQGDHDTDVRTSQHITTDIPAYTEWPQTNFTLGTTTAEDCATAIDNAYNEAVHFRPNAFDVPSGSVGKEFVQLLSQYLLAFGNGSSFRCQGFKVAMLFQMLLLQKPFHAPPSAFAKCLKRRLELWRAGAISDLIEECRTIHKQIESHQRRQDKACAGHDDTARKFASLITDGKLRSALAQLEEDNGGGVLNLDDRVDGVTVRDILAAKHPPAEPAHPDAIVQGVLPPRPHPVRFESLTGDVVRRVALNTHGAAGPSGVDADTWRRMCTGFGGASGELCEAMATCARRLATTFVDPASLEAYLACRLIPLDKNPGVRPIGIGEVLRRILGKAILSMIRDDIQEAAGSLQVCAGHESGIEAAVHAMTTVFDDDDTEALLMADASNAFNRLNREACLHNIQHLCPAMSAIVINTYRHPANLIVGGEVIRSREGTTQGDPIAMPLYALGVLPLLRSVATEGTVQAWFADDSSAGGKLVKVRAWWDALTTKGPLYGYHLNPSKSVLLVKPAVLGLAQELFRDTGVTIRVDGCRYLGAAIGTAEFLQSYVEGKVQSWIGQLERLTVIASSQPQAAFSAFTSGLKHKWSFLCRTMSNAAPSFGPLESAIRDKLIPAITGRQICEEDRAVLALPCRYGGLGIIDPTQLASQHQSSKQITRTLQQNIIQQVMPLGDAICDGQAAKKAVQTSARNALRTHAATVCSSLSADQQRTVELAAEKGASGWLTCRPLKRHGFAMAKAEFRDGLHLRYNWRLPHMPSACSCGSQFTIAHALSCPTGGYPSIRHNEIRDVTAGLLKRVATNVSVEPHLEPLSGEQLSLRTAIRADAARLDVAANGIWGGRFERTYIDVRVFNPFAPSNRSSSVSAAYTRHEKAKKRSYEQRLRDVEHASFVPAVFSTTGGMSKCASALYKRIAVLLAEKTGESYSLTMAFIRCRLSVALIRASVMCVRGSRSMFSAHAPVASSAAVVAAEASIMAD